jgi:hypothetical protein
MTRKIFALLGLLVASGFAACAEQLDSTVGCPIVCPQQTLPLRDTIIDAVVFDTSVAAFPALGFEGNLLLSNRPDTFETRVIARFDTLPTHARRFGDNEDIEITKVDTVGLVLQLQPADSLRQPDRPYVIEVYDVSPVGDTSTAQLLALFTPDRLIAQEQFEPQEAFSDIREILLPADFISAKIVNREPLRLGIRIVADGSAELRLRGSLEGTGIYLSMNVFGDEVSPRVTVATQSRFPEGELFQQRALADFTIVALHPPKDPNVLRVGGYPASRAYLRFDIPRWLLDSTIVIRATLVMHQKPVLVGPSSDQLLTIFQLPLLGSPAVIQDVGRLLEFIGPARFLGMDSLVVVPRSGGQRLIEIGPLARRWLGTDPDIAPRVVVLRTRDDSAFPQLADFYSIEAPAELRPKLRVTYAPRTIFGLP